MGTAYSWNGTSNDFDVSTAFTPERASPAVDDDITILQNAGVNPWTAGPAAPQTIGTLVFADNGTSDEMPADAANLTVTGAADMNDTTGANNLGRGTFEGATTLKVSHDTIITGTFEGPLIVGFENGSYDPTSPADFSGGTFTDIDSLVVNNQAVVGGAATWPNVAVTVNNGGWILAGTFAGPVTFKSGGNCAHGGVGTLPEFDAMVTFESGANVYGFNADDDMTFESGTWNLQNNTMGPWTCAGDVYLEGGDWNVNASNFGVAVAGSIYIKDSAIAPNIDVASGANGASEFNFDLSLLPAGGGAAGMLMPL